VVVRQGDPCTHIYIIKQGEYEVSKAPFNNAAVDQEYKLSLGSKSKYSLKNLLESQKATGKSHMQERASIQSALQLSILCQG
jgi:hypothetical protein